MSLTLTMIRRGVVSVLRDATLAGGRVHDSAIQPIDMIAGEAAPFLTVATEDRVVSGIEDRDLTGGTRTAELVIEIGTGMAQRIAAPSGDGVAFEIMATDDGQELTLDLIERQVTVALMRFDGSAWSRFLRGAINKFEKVTVRRGIKADQGNRAAFRQILIEMDIIGEPAIGAAPTGAWAEGVEAVRGDPRMAGLADVLEAVMIGNGLSDEESAWVSRGYDGAQARALGFAKLVPDGQALSEVVVEGTP